MDIQSKTHTLVIKEVSLPGRIDAFVSGDIRQQLDHFLEEGYLHFVINLSDTLFLDSAGLAVLVHLLMQTRKNKGSVRLILPNKKEAMRTLELTKFDLVFQSISSDDILPQISI